VPAHQRPLLFLSRRIRSGPQLIELGEVGVHRRGVQHEQPRGLVTAVAEGMGGSPGHEQEVIRPTPHFGPVHDERHGAVQDEESLGGGDMTVRQRSASPRRQRTLHQGKVSARLVRDSLERHHAAAGTEDLAAFPGGNDVFPGHRFLVSVGVRTIIQSVDRCPGKGSRINNTLISRTQPWRHLPLRAISAPLVTPLPASFASACYHSCAEIKIERTAERLTG
jgi:hypothetical protein